jgi:hypothetical protein
MVHQHGHASFLRKSRGDFFQVRVLAFERVEITLIAAQVPAQLIKRLADQDWIHKPRRRFKKHVTGATKKFGTLSLKVRNFIVVNRQYCM